MTTIETHTADHHLDRLLQSLAPTIVVPRHGKFVPLATPGHRFCLTSNKVWLELRNQWLYCLVPISNEIPVAMPGGELTPQYDTFYGAPPVELFERFKQQAKQALPLETGAWITWSTEKGFRYYELEATVSTATRLDYKCPDLEEGEELVFDLHSHGKGHAFFSPDDDADDRHHVRFSGVLGRVDQSEMDFKMRLCAKGRFVEMTDVFSIVE